jgi:hypothetical protein
MELPFLDRQTNFNGFAKISTKNFVEILLEIFSFLIFQIIQDSHNLSVPLKLGLK